MKNQINTSNLSPEQIEDLKQQLKAFDKQPKNIMDRVKSWEDANRITINKNGYFINVHSQILSTQKACSGDYNKNIVPSEKHAKSILATSQLMVIAEALNEGWNPDYGNRGKKWGVYIDRNKFGVNWWTDTMPNQFVFKSKELAEHTINQFPDLWYDCFMIDKPTKQ